MRKRFSYLAAATLSFGMMGWVANTHAADPAPAADDTKSAAEKATDATKDAAKETKDAVKDVGNKIGAEFSTAGSIRDTLANATEAAVTKGGFDDLVERLADPDRNRIGKDRFAEQKFDDLDGRIDQLQKDWKAKYNQDFKIKDQDAVFTDSFAKIETGEIGDGNARLASDQQKNSEATPPGNADVKTDDQKKSELTKGRNIASVTIPASHDMPELTVPLIHEAPLGKWKINVPDGVDGPKLKENLLKHLTMVGDMKDQWPADVNDAYRMVSHHVIAAVLDSDNKKSSDTGGATGASEKIESAPPATPANP